MTTRVRAAGSRASGIGHGMANIEPQVDKEHVLLADDLNVLDAVVAAPIALAGRAANFEEAGKGGASLSCCSVCICLRGLIGNADLYAVFIGSHRKARHKRCHGNDTTESNERFRVQSHGQVQANGEAELMERECQRRQRDERWSAREHNACGSK